MKILKISLVLVFLSVLFISGCNSAPDCKDVKVPYTINNCDYELKIDRVNFEYLDDPVRSNEAYECSNRQGLGIANYGNFEITWEFTNQNDILLSVPCEIIVRKYEDTNYNLLDEKVVERLNVNIPAQNTKTLTEEVYLPKCYGEMIIDCNDVNELPECKPITKYKTERKCE